MNQSFKEALLEFDKMKVMQIASEVSNNNESDERVFTLISETLSELGDEWAKGEIALSQIYMTSRICEEVIQKQIRKNPIISKEGNAIAITTFMDYHILGKKIVYSNLLSCGMNIIDFGTTNSPEELVEKILTHKIEVMLISTLMYHSAIKIKEVKDLLLKEKSSTKIIVGGAPFIFDDQLWQQVEADAMGHSSTDAIKLINQWSGIK